MNQAVGFTVFSIGIIISVLGGAKVPEGDATWPTTLVLFAVGAFVSIVGLVIWRMAAQKATASESESSEQKGPDSLLTDLIEPLEKLGQEIEELESETITSRIDELLDGYVLPFAGVRQRIVHKLGMEKGAEILVVVAYGERMLNRVWSAAADGHLPEARSCYPEALEAFAEARRLLDAHSSS